MKKALLHLNHALIKSLIQKDDFVVDMTCGNGYDTEFLASLSTIKCPKKDKRKTHKVYKHRLYS